MKNRGSTLILTNLVGVHPRNIHTNFDANPCSGFGGEVENVKSLRPRQRRRRRTQPDPLSHTHSLSVTKNQNHLSTFLENLFSIMSNGFTFIFQNRIIKLRVFSISNYPKVIFNRIIYIRL